jgi:inositol 3-alpha-galactosyltransferase
MRAVGGRAQEFAKRWEDGKARGAGQDGDGNGDAAAQADAVTDTEASGNPPADHQDFGQGPHGRILRKPMLGEKGHGRVVRQ